jgi:hypothetical protein
MKAEGEETPGHAETPDASSQLTKISALEPWDTTIPNFNCYDQLQACGLVLATWPRLGYE